jgi:hypothetical protein
VAADYEKLRAICRFLQRTKTAAEIKAIALDAFQKVQDGVQLTSVSFEGGQGSGQISCDPSVLLNACEDVLLALGETLSVPQPSVVFTSFCGSPIRT